MNGIVWLSVVVLLAFNILWWIGLSKRLERWVFQTWLPQRWNVRIEPNKRYKGTWQIQPSDAAKLSRGARIRFNIVQTLYPLLTLIFAMISLFTILWLLATLG